MNSSNGVIINSLSNIPMIPSLDTNLKQLFSKQPLFCNFTISGSPVIHIECGLSLQSNPYAPQQWPKHKIKGVLNLSEFVSPFRQPQVTTAFVNIPIPNPA